MSVEATPTAPPEPLDLRAFFDASPFATVLFTPDLILLDSNAAHARLTGVPTEALRGRAMFEVFPKNDDALSAGLPDVEGAVRASVARVLDTGRPDEMEPSRHDLVRADGTFDRRYWRMIHSPVRAGDRIVAIRQDVSDVTEAELRRDRHVAMQRIAGAASGVAFWQQDFATGLILRTPSLDAICGLPPVTEEEAAIPVSADTFRGCVPEADRTRLAAMMDSILAEGPGATREAEHTILRPDGEVRTVTIRCEHALGEAERPVVVGTTLDVTDLRANERRLEALVAEKEVLLGEAAHRVKNALQLVASLMSLEARAVPDAVRPALARSAARVQAVAEAHAAFYHDDDVRTVEFGEHLRAMCARLAAGAPRASIRCEAVRASLPAERAVSLSLIVNELVSRAISDGSAAVEVRLGRAGEGRLRLVVTGGPAGGEAAGEALGDRIVRTLLRQVGGARTDATEGGRPVVTIDFDG